mmetsp:Transcript_20505/g.50197  ORF Transcript_20505/g.50197 Transcript_20505/m.50197 type:complete len:212 (+) Transcript_20505:594-1229(+)
MTPAHSYTPGMFSHHLAPLIEPFPKRKCRSRSLEGLLVIWDIMDASVLCSPQGQTAIITNLAPLQLVLFHFSILSRKCVPEDRTRRARCGRRSTGQHEGAMISSLTSLCWRKLIRSLSSYKDVSCSRFTATELATTVEAARYLQVFEEVSRIRVPATIDLGSSLGRNCARRLFGDLVKGYRQSQSLQQTGTAKWPYDPHRRGECGVLQWLT